ncbi:MAG: endonuclease III, partial [Planctomycetia bacterium]
MPKKQTERRHDSTPAASVPNEAPGDRDWSEEVVDLKRRSGAVRRLLKKLYPNAHCELDFRNPFELLCATILSAQCTDVQV